MSSARHRRLPADLAWPLSRTDLASALGPAATQLVSTRFLKGPGGVGSIGGAAGTTVLSVRWLPPDPARYGRGTHPDAVGPHLDVHAVPAVTRAEVRALLRTTALPALQDWLGRAATADDTWRHAPHTHTWHFTAGRLTDEESRE